MKFNLDDPWFTRFVAALSALLLFAFVNYENQSVIRSTNPTDGASITSSEIITNLPIDINIDGDNYFVSGIPDSATIRLEGPQAVLIQTTVTQNFNIVTPDLNEYGVGTHRIELEAEGLSSQLNYGISPSEITLTIEEKRIEDYEISVEFDEEAHLADGFSAGEPVLSSETVQISGAVSTMAQISDVRVVVIPDSSDITEDIEMTLNILVLDDTGEPLNVNIDPQQVDVLIPVEGTQRTLPIVLRESGTPEEDLEYTLEIAQGESENITVTGDSDSIEEMNNFPIDVDVSGVTESTVREIPIVLPEGVTDTDPKNLDIVIRVSSAQDASEEENNESGE